MKFFPHYILCVLLCIAPASSQQEAHKFGQSFGTSQANKVKDLAKSTDLKDVPGYQTDRPPEAELDSTSLDEASISRLKENTAAQHVLTQAKERQSFKLDPTTDPLFKGTADIVSDPHQSLKEELEDIDPPQSQEETIVTCEESGQEYVQKCWKKLVIELKIIPEKGYHTPTWCIEHWENEVLGTKYSCDGCRGGDYVITQNKSVIVMREEWIDTCKILENLTEQGLCTYVNKVTSPANETKMIQGEPITRPHFEEHLEYACLRTAPRSCAGLREKGCYQIKSACKEKKGDLCVLWEQTYRCPTGLQTSRRYKTTNKMSPFCLSGDCADTSYQANGELLTVMSQMAALKEIQKDLQNFTSIFKGEDRRCTRNCLNFRDCCTNGKGWGVSLHLSSCSTHEKELDTLREKNRCVLVGTYCAEKEKMTGICLRKKTTFCCFGTKMARLLQQAGRAQLGLSWGTPESPQCGGFRAEQLSKIDFSKIDFSEIFSDITQGLTVKDQKQSLATVSTQRVQENMTLLTKKEGF